MTGVHRGVVATRAEGPRLTHIAATLLLVAYWAAETLASQFSIHFPSVLNDLWYSAVPFVAGFVLGLAVGLLVARWWLLLAALTPVVVLGALELAGHRSPWHDSGPPLTQYGWFPVVWVNFWLFLLPIVLGVSLRRGLGERGSGSIRTAGET